MSAALPSEASPSAGSPASPDKHPATWVPTLYFMEGLPNIITVMVSVLMYKSMGLKDGEIAFFTSLITYPWILKPLWSPLLELVKNQKGAVILTQLLGGAAFGCLALAIPSDNFLPITLALFALIAFNSATHDIVADGVYVNVLNSETQAKYVGIQGASYNIARFLAQGGLVVAAGKLEDSWGVNPAWMAAMGAVGVLMVVMAVWHMRSLPAHRQEREENQSVSEVFSTFAEVTRTFFQKKNIWWSIAFICLFRFSEGNQVKIVPLFLRAARDEGGLGLTTADVGVAYGVFASIAFVGGSLLGGYMTSRLGLKRSLLILCAAFNIPNACYLFLATVRPESLAMVNGVVLIETFGWGFGFVGLPLYIMQEVAPGKYKMAHYAFGTAVMFLGFLLPSTFSGYISDALGYQGHFIWVLFATIPSFFVAWKVPILRDPGVAQKPTDKASE